MPKNLESTPSFPSLELLCRVTGLGSKSDTCNGPDQGVTVGDSPIVTLGVVLELKTASTAI